MVSTRDQIHDNSVFIGFFLEAKYFVKNVILPVARKAR